MGRFTGKGLFTLRPGLWKELSIVLVCLFLALWLRLGELKRMKDRPLDPDVLGYVHHATQMMLFSETGFYSGRFGMREPLYILVVKMIFHNPFLQKMNIRYVSLLFSICLVFLTYYIARAWMGPATGLTASFLLAFQTYFIELSARGLRSEFFSVLFLLFLYFAFIRSGIKPVARVFLTGILAGLVFLTRTEAVFPVILFLLLLPFLRKKMWNKKMAICAIFIGIILVLPHFWSMYRVTGDPFYTNNKNASFFTNLEFAGKPGFPTQEEIEREGMYAGPKVTPFDYFFSFHPVSELLRGNLWGLAKIYICLSLRYIPTPTWGILKQQGTRIGVWAGFILKRHPLQALLGALAGICFLGGILTLWAVPEYRLLYLILIIFQIQTAFLFSKGLETRVVVHTWPVALWVTAFFMKFCSERFLKYKDEKGDFNFPL
ncbi:glycosyltransferase family 39 protein [bacterium]|nr:glycosyltransferase family 39 protein [bacterium]